MSSRFANVNHCIVKLRQYQPLYRQVLSISTIVSLSFANINHCTVISSANINFYIVDFCGYYSSCRRVCQSSSFANINHFVVKFCKYQPLYRRVLPMSSTVSSRFCQYRPLYRGFLSIPTTVSSRLANIHNFIAKVCQYQPLCRQLLPTSTLCGRGLPISTTVFGYRIGTPLASGSTGLRL